MSKARFTLTPDAEDFLSATFSKNRELYGGLRMEANGDGGDGDGDGDGGDKGGDGGDASKSSGDGGKGEEPKPSETVEYWKKRSRENEKRAKDNAEAAKKYAEVQEAQKTEEQKRIDAEAKQKQEAESLRLENLRLKAAGTHGVLGEDSEGIAYADLISGTDEASVKTSAEAIGRLIASAKQAEELQKKLDEYEKGRPATGRPSGARAGATPPGDPANTHGAGGISEAERRFGKQDASK